MGAGRSYSRTYPSGRYLGDGGGLGRWPARRVLRPYGPTIDRAAAPIDLALALRVLRSLAGALEAGLLALFDAGIAGEEASLA
jgi:hypothetical protein